MCVCEALLASFSSRNSPNQALFFLLSHLPYEKPYIDLLECLEDGFACVFSLLSIILKLNTTQEAYPVQKGLFIDNYPTVIV